MDIRILTEEDAATFQALRLRALGNNPEAFGSTYEESKDRSLTAVAERIRPEGNPPESFVLGAFNDSGTLIGMTGFFREQYVKMRHKGVIWGMYVAPEARGQGVGRALLQEAISRATELAGLEQINLMVVTTNIAARQLYLSLGFRVYGFEYHAMKQGDAYWDEELMVLLLSG